MFWLMLFVLVSVMMVVGFATSFYTWELIGVVCPMPQDSKWKQLLWCFVSFYVVGFTTTVAMLMAIACVPWYMAIFGSLVLVAYHLTAPSTLNGALGLGVTGPELCELPTVSPVMA